MKKKIYTYKRFWLLMLVIVYLLFGFFYVPKIINEQIQNQLSEQLNMQAEMTAVRFNPITFTTELDDLSIIDGKQENWFSSKEVAINFDPMNLIWGEWKFSDLQLEQPNITLLTDVDGRVLIPNLPEFPESTETTEPIDLSIENIQLQHGKMNIQAGNIKEDFTLVVKSLAIKNEQFSLADVDNQFDITITTENDETLALSGFYNHFKQLVNSKLQLSDWQATTLNQILPDHLMINNQAGLIQATGDIDWLMSQNPKLNFSTIEISDLTSSWQDNIHLNDFTAEIVDVAIDSETQIIQVDKVNSQQANWLLHWPITQVENNIEKPSTGSTDDSNWQVNFNQVEITDWPVELNDQELDATLSLNVDSLVINGINNLSESFTVNSQITMAEEGVLIIESEQSLTPLNLNGNLKISDLTLEQLAPWITEHSGLVLTQGTLGSTQQVVLAADNYDLNGNLTINDAIIQNQAEQRIADIGQLAIAATTISSQNKSIVVDQITLDQANGNIIIDADKNINIQNLKGNEESNQTDQSNQPSNESSDWIIKVGAINIKDTSTALIDQSVDPVVNTKITELNGQIKGLSSESLSKADVDISGKFNQFSPLSIQGKFNPLSSDAYTDLKVVIEDLDLLAFSPYSASYVAFPINGGKVNLELEYSLNQHELIGKNNMLFKQLKFGSKVNAPDAIQLPLKLAVSLLSDGKGEMKINLPVSGNINDPEFSYGSLIGKALFKLITGIVASPFKLLGKLIPNPDPNLSDIQFNAGSAELLDSEKNKLNQIVEIMAKKTELNLQLNPHIDNNFDTLALKKNVLLQSAPFDSFDASDASSMQWLESQLPPEELTAFANEAGHDHEKIWQALIQKQVINEEQIKALTENRNLSIKNYLLDSAGIAAEKVFVEQTQMAENNQATIKIGVSR